MKLRHFLPLIAIFLLAASSAIAETGEAAWLRYAPIRNAQALKQYASLPEVIVSLDRSEVAMSAQSELTRGVGAMLGKTLRCSHAVGRPLVSVAAFIYMPATL